MEFGLFAQSYQCFNKQPEIERLNLMNFELYNEFTEVKITFYNLEFDAFKCCKLLE